MRVYNTWREVKLSTSLAETIVQNISGLTLLIKFGLTLPTDDDDAIYIASRRGISDSVYNYDHTKDKMYVRILEDLDSLGQYEEIRRYITVINDEPHYNGFEIHHGAGLMDFSITNATYVFWELADGSTSTLTNPSVILPVGTSILYADFYKNDIEIRDNSTNSNYIGDLKDLPNLNYLVDLQLTNITGDISTLTPLYSLRLDQCSNIVGDLSELEQIENFLHLGECSNIHGILNPCPTLKSIFLFNTAMTPNDTDETIKKLRNKTAITSGGTLYIKTNRTSISDKAFNYLSANGWTITEI